MRILYIFILLSWLALPLSAQYQLKGTVMDATNNQPLPFVNIIFNFDNHLNATTDIDGLFEFENDAPIVNLTISYIGYFTDTIQIEDSTAFIQINLKKTAIATQEIVVIAGENPAYRIVRKAAKNRRRHNPELIPKYTYDSYNKITVFDQYNAPNIHDSIPKEEQLDFYYSLMETISEVKYIAPDKRVENILATQLSGFKNPTFMTAITDIQPIDFHKENFLILDKEFLSPISDNAVNKYEYRIEDTLYQEQDTVFLLSFFPRKNKNFDALKGSIYINTRGYALQNIIAEPSEPQKIHLRIHQKYSLIDSSTWFPEQLNFEIELTPQRKATYTVQGKRYIENVQLQPDISPKDFGVNKSTMEEDATKKEIDFWQKNRKFQLTAKEEKTYKVINDIAKKMPLDLIMGAFTELGEERIVLDHFAVNYTQVMGFNLHEQFRLGLGLYTSNQWSKYVTFGGYFAYGFKDKKWKWGGSLELRPLLNKDFAFGISYIDDIVEPAGIIQKEHALAKKVLPTQSFARRNVLNQMDKTYEMDLSVYFRSFRYLQTRIFGNWSHKIPLYDYQFMADNGQPKTSFRVARVGIQLRYSYKEDYVQLGAFNLKARSRFPVFYLNYTKGLAGVLDGEFDYHKITTAIESSFFVKGFGRTILFLQGGWIGGKVPYPILFNGRGSFDRWRMFMVRGTFQTMRPNEFVVDKFAYLFLEHNFGSLLFNTKKFKPEVKIYQSIGFGWLTNQHLHQGIPIQDMSKGYFESGLMLSNLIQLNMLNFGRFGMGAGIFVRYGHYWLPSSAWDNISIKIDMGVSF